MIKFTKRGDEAPENTKPVEAAPEKPEIKAENQKKSENAVLTYALILFAVVLLLVALSYFVQQRRANATISTLTEQHSEFSIQALQNIEELQKSNQQLEKDLEAGKERISELEEELEKTKSDWAADTKRLNGEAQAALDEQKKKTEAMTALFDLYAAIRNGGVGAQETLERLEPLADKLDGAYTEMYETLKEQVK